jgi:hypothetical protein
MQASETKQSPSSSSGASSAPRARKVERAHGAVARRALGLEQDVHQLDALFLLDCYCY